MVPGAINQPPQSSQLSHPPSTAPPATTEEEEFFKRNTDCFYFLASPLTCKKGSECEYRHSDIARVNPRDCYYWLNGNCLNPKCGFRHPPLDGLLGAEVPAPVQPFVSQPAKQGVACIFFQKGFCLKGHLCPFLHGPPQTIVSNKPVQPVPPVTKPPEQKFSPQENVQKPVAFQPPQVNQVPKKQARNGGVMEKKVAPPPEEPPRYRPANHVAPPVMNEFQVRSNHFSDNEGINGKDVEEYSREPSPGFDVLVDTEVNDSEYYPNEEQFGRPVDYDVDQDMYPEKRDYAWEEHRESSNFGRKRYPRDDSPDKFDFDQSDLRHRLSKQRRGDNNNNNNYNNNNNNIGGLRSVIGREHPCDSHLDWLPRRDGLHDRQLDPGSLSSRLRGRIKIPGNENGSRVEREIRQNHSRYSQGRPLYGTLNHSRLRDRDYREFGGPKRLSELKSQQTDDGQTLGKRKYPRSESQQSEVNASFEGPKPLSEILKRKRGPVISSVVSIEDNNENNHNQEEIKELSSVIMVNNEKSTDGQSCLNNEVGEVDNKVGSVDEDAKLDRELEAFDIGDQRDGDYDYEQMDGEDYNLEEGEDYNLEEGEDYLEEERE